MSYTSNNNVKIFMSFVECNILFSDYCLQNTVLKAFSIHHVNVSNLSPMRGIVLLAYFKKGNRNLGSVIWSYRTYLFIYSCPHSKYIDWKANIVSGYSMRIEVTIFTFAFPSPIKKKNTYIIRKQATLLSTHLHSYFTIHSYCALQKSTKPNT